jgi:hypothetical protein
MSSTESTTPELAKINGPKGSRIVVTDLNTHEKVQEVTFHCLVLAPTYLVDLFIQKLGSLAGFKEMWRGSYDTQMGLVITCRDDDEPLECVKAFVCLLMETVQKELESRARKLDDAGAQPAPNDIDAAAPTSRSQGSRRQKEVCTKRDLRRRAGSFRR